MIVSTDSSKLQKSFAEFSRAFERKLNNMVRGFAYEISSQAIQNTPLGNAAEFINRYMERQVRFGLNPVEGYARGSWQVKKDSQFTTQEIYGVQSGKTALTAISASLSSITFKDNIFIGNRGYYIALLENNYSSQTNNLGIMKPTMQSVVATYAIDMKSLYDKG